MDQRLEKALEFAQYSQTLNNQKNIIYKQYKDDCYHYTDGCAFAVTPELITFCNLMISYDKPLVLLDSNNTPIEITDPKKFIEDIIDVYVQSVNSYLVKYQNFKDNKTIKDFLDL